MSDASSRATPSRPRDKKIDDNYFRSRNTRLSHQLPPEKHTNKHRVLTEQRLVAAVGRELHEVGLGAADAEALDARLQAARGWLRRRRRRRPGRPHLRHVLPVAESPATVLDSCAAAHGLGHEDHVVAAQVRALPRHWLHR